MPPMGQGPKGPPSQTLIPFPSRQCLPLSDTKSLIWIYGDPVLESSKGPSPSAPSHHHHEGVTHKCKSHVSNYPPEHREPWATRSRGTALDGTHSSQGGIWNVAQLECSSVSGCRIGMSQRAGSLRCLLLGKGPLRHKWLESSGRSRDSQVHIAPGECSLKMPRTRFSKTS